MSSELLILNNRLQQHRVVADFVVLALFITVYWRRAVPVMFPIFHFCQVYVVVWLWLLTMNCPDTVKTLMQCSQTWFQVVSWLPACLLEWVTFSIISCGMSSLFFSPPLFPVSPSSSIQYRCLFSSLSACFALDPPPLRITRLQWWSSVFSCRKPLNHGCLPSLCTCFRTPYNHWLTVAWRFSR